MNNSKKVYMTPMVEIMNARVEKGFAGSGDALTGNPLETVDEGNNGNGDNTGSFDMD